MKSMCVGYLNFPRVPFAPEKELGLHWKQSHLLLICMHHNLSMDL